MDILMPQLGETVAEGKISAWFKTVGDAVKPGDNLFEIETDKVTMEVPATSAGVLTDIRVQTGEVAPVGAVVAVIGDGSVQNVSSPARSGSGSAAPSAATPPPVIPVQAGIQSLGARFREDERQGVSARPPMPLELFREVRTPERNFGPARLSGGIKVTPLARRLAGENGIDLTKLKGSGPHGRIVARDVEQAAGSAHRGAQEPSAAQIMALYRDTPFTEMPLDGMRKTVAARLTQAVQTIPHFTLSADAEIDALQAAREEMNAAAPKKDGEAAYKISLNDFIIKALALALQRVPQANAVWAGDRILRFTHSDLGVAVAIEDGLLTPVIRKADTKSLGAISAEMHDLSTRAHDKALKPQEYQGGATSISNLGMHGVREFSAIINPPQASILAVGAARRAPVETGDGGISFVTQMTLTLSCDHRVMDGVTGAALLAAVKGLLERPVTMLV